MKSTLLWALCGANVLLAILLVGRLGGEDVANAQAGARMGDYLMIPGEVSGAPSAIVYVIDMTNGYLGGISYDDSKKRLNWMVPQNLNEMFDRLSGGGAGRGR